MIHGRVRFPRKKAATRFKGFAQKALKLGNIVGCFVKKHKKTMRHPTIPVTTKNGMAIAFSKRRLFIFCKSETSASVQMAKTKNGEKYQLKDLVPGLRIPSLWLARVGFHYMLRNPNDT